MLIFTFHDESSLAAFRGPGATSMANGINAAERLQYIGSRIQLDAKDINKSRLVMQVV